jgi:hypothetical protein
VIEVVIDELVVRGLSPGEAHAVAAALEARLATLASDAGDTLPARAEAFRRLPPVSAPAGVPGALGDTVAGAVWSAVSGEGRP